MNTKEEIKPKFPTLGEKLKYFRKRSGLSQLELETEINASAGMISRIEKGFINPTKETIQKIIAVIKLSGLEISYLIGELAKPATEEDIQEARNEVRGHFSNKTILAYLLDDRSRMLDISVGFKKLLALDQTAEVAFLGKTMPQIILDPSLGLRKYIETEDFKESLYFAFNRTWDEMNFMIGDPFYTEIVYWIEQEAFLKKIWKEFYEGKSQRVRTEESRTVYFDYQGKKIRMLYTNETLPKFPRFRIVEYTPTNYVIKLLQKFI
ncbi:helix-turn-helix transcriptional regulator [Candidatus Dojkabacteria bacterium]|nr:helix-turn-helix transcriptional regulator [Candidatus Dojkabacteria bacterium]